MEGHHTELALYPVAYFSQVVLHHSASIQAANLAPLSYLLSVWEGKPRKPLLDAKTFRDLCENLARFHPFRIRVCETFDFRRAGS